MRPSWIVDRDQEGRKLKSQIPRREFIEDNLAKNFKTLPQENDLDDKLAAGGHDLL